MITQNMVDDKGLIEIYDIPSKKLRRVRPIDAKEMITVGTARLPDTEDRGAPKAPSPIPNDFDPGADPYKQYKLARLREEASDLGIPGSSSMNRRSVVAALMERGWNLPDSGVDAPAGDDDSDEGGGAEE